MEKQIQAFIFDLDGVIVETAQYHYLSWKKLCQEQMGVDLTIEENQNLKGISRKDSLDWILNAKEVDASQDQKNQWLKMKNEWYLEFIQEMTQDELLPGVLPFLKKCQSEKIKISLASSSRNAKLVLNAIGITPYFDAIVDGTDILFSKPNPEIFFRACDRLRVLGNEAVVFEDAQSGIEGALEAGCYVIGVGHEPLQNAHHYVKNFNRQEPNQIKQILQSK